LMNEFQMAFALLGWHALADYPLQGDFMAKAKNPKAPLPGVPWETVMTAHALIHGFGVSMITGSVVLGLAETVSHWLIDVAKCFGKLDLRADQGAHFACKIAWFALAPLGLP